MLNLLSTEVRDRIEDELFQNEWIAATYHPFFIGKSNFWADSGTWKRESDKSSDNSQSRLWSLALPLSNDEKEASTLSLSSEADDRSTTHPEKEGGRILSRVFVNAEIWALRALQSFRLKFWKLWKTTEISIRALVGYGASAVSEASAVSWISDRFFFPTKRRTVREIDEISGQMSMSDPGSAHSGWRSTRPRTLETWISPREMRPASVRQVAKYREN